MSREKAARIAGLSFLRLRVSGSATSVSGSLWRLRVSSRVEWSAHGLRGQGSPSHVSVARGVITFEMPSRGVDTPIGTLGLVASERGLTGVRWSAKGLPNDPSPLLDEAASQLEAYFAGELTSFELPLDLAGTEFQRRCWLALATIPYGRAVSYGEQARRLGLGRDAARAVGTANGQNPLPVILPCHRVIGADGSLTGFGGGLRLKRFLLEHEGALLSLG
jgi:methylated-DNA-[protein]-cysteine S-methyltransferase